MVTVERTGVRIERTIGVVVVEDHWVWADAVVHQLQKMHGVSCVGVAANAAEALRLCSETMPRIALVDLLLGKDSGIRVARTLRSRFPGLRIVIVTVEPSPLAIAEAREAGLAGFVCKDDLLTRGQVTDLVDQMLAGREVFSQRALDLEAGSAAGEGYGITAEDREMIRLFSRGLGTAEVARRMCLADQTVRNRTSRIGAKLGVSGRLEIVAKALDEGIITTPNGLS